MKNKSKFFYIFFIIFFISIITIIYSANKIFYSKKYIKKNLIIWEEKKKDFRRKYLNEDIIGKIILPNQVNIPIVEGTDQVKLKNGAAHVESSAMPGQVGNSIILGHRDGVFRHLKYLNIKDLVKVETLKKTYTYKVTSINIIDPTKEEIIKDYDKRKSLLTFVTCYPFNYIGAAPKRFVVTLLLCS